MEWIWMMGIIAVAIGAAVGMESVSYTHLTLPTIA